MVFLRYWLPSLVWMGVIYWLSSIPDLKTVPLVLTLLNWLGLDTLPAMTGAVWDWEWLLRKSAHVTVFFILTLLYARSLRETWPRLSVWCIPVAVGLALAYAFFDEWHQSWVPTRSGRLKDVLIDGMGILAGAMILGTRVEKIKGAED